MKKLSLIVALAVVLTMGGVFAAWNYYESGITAASSTITITSSADVSGQGSLSVNATTMQLSVDQKDTVSNIAVLNGFEDIVVTFEKTDESVAEATLKMKITITGNSQWESKDLFTITTTDIALGNTTYVDDTHSTYTISKDVLKQHIKLGADHVIANSTEHGQFLTKLQAVTISISISGEAAIPA